MGRRDEPAQLLTWLEGVADSIPLRTTQCAHPSAAPVSDEQSERSARTIHSLPITSCGADDGALVRTRRVW